MREFSYLERKYIVEHQDTKELGEIARKFGCDWKEVYACFCKIVKTKAYRKYAEKRKEGISYGKGFDEIEYVEEQARKNRKGDNLELHNPLRILTHRALDNDDYYTQHKHE